MRVRTRFAPSPTGYMHIGNLRTALFEYLIAKSQGGDFVLRIEDTDTNRKVDGSVEVIYNTLRIAGLRYDEGPDIGGKYGPYVQSERKCSYIDYAKRLIDEGKAYYCFCSKERLDSMTVDENKGFKKYDRHCLALSAEEIQKNLSAGMPYVIRQFIPEGETTFIDEVYGKITVNNSELDDQILIKSDGMPTYNFANVIDDHLMNITHVVRGCEYISSTPKYNLLYDAFGWDVPKYVHLPLVLNADGNKLSKRKGDASFEDLLSLGFLPEAIINYIALLGWSPQNIIKEFFTLEELVESFSVKGLGKSPSIFDIQKLTWMNGEYFKKMSFEEFKKIASETVQKAISNKNIDLDKILEMVKTRINFISEISSLIDFFNELPGYCTDLYINKKMKTDKINALSFLNKTYLELDKLTEWNNEAIYNVMISIAENDGVKKGAVLWSLRVALSGKLTTPCGASEIAELIGKRETLNRIKYGIELLNNNN